MLRAAKILLPLVLLFPVVGCEWLDRMKAPTDDARVTGGPIKPVTADQLVGYLNRQSAQVKSLRYPDLVIDVQAGKEHHNLNNCTLVCSRPRNFLLVGGKMVMSEIVNLGSNDREFWMYSRFPDPTYVFCSHADFQRGAGQLPFPFDPDWAVQALGMKEYDPGLAYRVETDDRTGEHVLSFDGTTPQGAAVRTSVFFSAYEARNRPQVRRFQVVDAGTGQTVAAAEVKAVETLPTGRDAGGKPSYVQVPTRIVLDWPQQGFKMDLRLNRAKVNERLTESEVARMFARPRIDGVNAVNLAGAQYAPSSIRGATPSDRPPRRR